MLQTLLGTKQQVFLSTSSAWGVMEGAIRSLVKKKVLNCFNGAFSDKWLDVSRRCGKEAEAYQVELGSRQRDRSFMSISGKWESFAPLLGRRLQSVGLFWKS